MTGFDRTPRVSRTRPLGLASAGRSEAASALDDALFTSPRRRPLMLACAGGVTLAATAMRAQADLILSPTAVLSNSLGEFDSSIDIGNVIDRSGFSPGFDSGTTDFDTYLASSPTHNSINADNAWFSANNTTTGTIVFDLGALYQIERLAIWQGGRAKAVAATRNIKDITLDTSADPGFGTASSAGSFTVPQGTSDWPANVFDLTDTTGRYVRLTIDSNYGNTGNTRFGEIAFGVSAAAVPEPSSLLLFGVTLFTLLKRRRQR